MNIRKLNEAIKKALNELQVDPSFKDHIKQSADNERAQTKKEIDIFTDLNAEDWIIKQLTKRYKNKQQSEKVLKFIYDNTSIDLQHGGIKEISVPKSMREAIELIKGSNKALLLRNNERLTLCKLKEADDNVSLYALEFAQTDPVFTNRIQYNGRTLDLTRPSSLTVALKNQLFDKAWLAYGEDTTELKRERTNNRAGSDYELRKKGTYSQLHKEGRDRSGYIKRNLL